MSKIILCRGIQGSGKTTWSKKWVEEDPEHRIRYSNDDIRNILGKYWVPTREDVVRRLKMATITEAMEHGYDIVVDNMNLNPKEGAWYIGVSQEFEQRRRVHYEIYFQDFKTPLEECIRRDSLRPNSIGAKVITDTYNKYRDFYNQ